MGLEQEEDGQNADVASELVYELVWQIIQYEIGTMHTAYFSDLTETEYRLAFSPQDDFYFDGDGNFVFFHSRRVSSPVRWKACLPFRFPLSNS